MKIKIQSMFLFMFIFSACGSNVSSTMPTIVTSTSVLPTVRTSLTSTATPESEEIQGFSEEFFSKECQKAGYASLANFYPNVYFSPDEEWSFTSCFNFSEDTITYPFIVSNITQENLLVFSPEDIMPDFIEKYPSVWFTPIYWGKTEKNLIIRASLSCPDSFECIYEDGEALYMMDLGSGDFSVLLPPQVTSPRFRYAFSVSPDGKYLAYVNQSMPEVLHIQDLVSGNDQTVDLKGKYSKVGIFAWTPDSKDVAFVGLGSNIDIPTSSLFLLNTTNFSLSVLFNNRAGVYFPGSLTSDKIDYWYQQDILYLDSIDSYPLYVNIRTKEINRVPIPTP